MQKILVTGAAGFIGFHLVQRLLRAGYPVVGIDNLNAYYDPKLKHARLAILKRDENFTFIKIDLADRAATKAAFSTDHFPIVIHLAAQAGIRDSIKNASNYIDANLCGFANVLEGCRQNECTHLLYASSSSVYGANTKLPFSTRDNADHPINIYAATKKINELMAHSYSHLHGLPTTGLRFFTVYGPWYRPDMAMFLFAKAIVEHRSIMMFNSGDMLRDFIYIDDVVDVVLRLMTCIPTGNKNWSGNRPDPATSAAPWRVFNVGTNVPVRLINVIGMLEEQLGQAAKKEMLPMQPGDVYATCADIGDLTSEIGFEPGTNIQSGIANFASWFSDYHGLADRILK